MNPNALRLLALGALMLASGCSAGEDAPDPAGPASEIRITPDSLTLAVGATGQLTAQVFDSAGHVVLGARVKWWSDFPEITVDSLTGRVTALRVARAHVVAESDGIESQVLVKAPGPLAAIWATSAVDSVLPGGTVPFTLGFFDERGNSLEPSPVVWSVDEPALATISAAGVLTGSWPGLAHVRATAADTIIGYSMVRVLVPVATVQVEPAQLTLGTGTTYRSTVTLRDSAGGVITGRPLAWSATGSAIVLNENRVLATTTEGLASVVVSVEGRADTTRLDVRRYTIVTISAGAHHTCGLDGHDFIVCWGWNLSGQLGVTGVERVAGPVQLSDYRGWRTVSAGSQYTCALGDGSLAWCWGNNDYGQLGDGTLTSSTTPVPVAGAHAFTQISTGADHACAITTTGETYCWGNRLNGALGDGLFTGYSAQPVLVHGGHAFASIVAGYQATCGVEPDGVAWCWGHGLNGVLGVGNWGDYAEPTAVAGGLHFQSVYPGQISGCGLTTFGLSYCWGGGLPDVPTQVQYPTAFPVPWVNMDLSAHECMTNSNRELYCRGFNPDGRAGADESKPVLTTVTWVSLGNEHSCALSAGKAYCWGANDVAQLGSDHLSGPTPRLVAGQ